MIKTITAIVALAIFGSIFAGAAASFVWRKGYEEGLVLANETIEITDICLNTNNELLRQVDELLDASYLVTSELVNLTSDFILMYETNKEREKETARQAYNLSAEYVACQNDKQYLSILAQERLLALLSLEAELNEPPPYVPSDTGNSK